MDAIVLLLIAKATTVVGIILIIVLIPIWLPVFVLGGSVLVTRAIWKSSKRDYQNAERDDDNVQRKVQQSERKLQEARQDAILRAERDFEKTQCEVQDDERELEKVRNEAITDVETDLEKLSRTCAGLLNLCSRWSKNWLCLRRTCPNQSHPNQMVVEGCSQYSLVSKNQSRISVVHCTKSRSRSQNQSFNTRTGN